MLRRAHAGLDSPREAWCRRSISAATGLFCSSAASSGVWHARQPRPPSPFRRLCARGHAVRAAVTCLRCFKAGRIVLRHCLCSTVGLVEARQDQGVQINSVSAELMKHHGDGQAPVSQMIFSKDRAAPAFKNACQRIADDGRPEMPNVHLLGDVDSAQVDHDWSVIVTGTYTQRVVVHRLQCRDERGRLQADVDEPGTGDFRWFRQ